MLHPGQNVAGIGHDLMRRFTLDICHEANTTAVVFISRVVQSAWLDKEFRVLSRVNRMQERSLPEPNVDSKSISEPVLLTVSGENCKEILARAGIDALSVEYWCLICVVVSDVAIKHQSAIAAVPNHHLPDSVG